MCPHSHPRTTSRIRSRYTKPRRTQKKRDKTWSLPAHSCTSRTHAPIDQWSVLAAPSILAERNVNVIFFPFLRPFFGAKFYIQWNVSEKFSLLLQHMKKMTKKLPGRIVLSPHLPAGAQIGELCHQVGGLRKASSSQDNDILADLDRAVP